MKNLSGVDELKTRISEKGRVELGFYPTLLYPLKNISRQYDVEIILKREDLSGFSVFGGNKIRKLEFILYRAIEKGAKYIITFGATQSNHVMQTASACRRLGLEPIVFLLDFIGTDNNADSLANLHLDKILGAECHIITVADFDTVEQAKSAREDAAKERIKELEAGNELCFTIPAGGNNAYGSIGFTEAFVEAYEQNGFSEFDFMINASGTGGTLAGFLAGKRILGLETQLLSFTVSQTDDNYKSSIITQANDVMKHLGYDQTCKDSDILVDTEFYGPGYEIASDSSSRIIQKFARDEGVLLDPVYTGKAMVGLIEYIKLGKIPRGSRVCFIHTGGCTGLFAEKQIVGSLY